MYDYSEQIAAFLGEKVKLSKAFKDKLYNHRDANRNRIISRLPDLIEGVSKSSISFKPQGSIAMGTIIQTVFAEEEYDIDDGLILAKADLKDKNGKELLAKEMKVLLKEALEDERFKKQPIICRNCVRVFYAEEDAEKHHVDFPVYRKFKDDDGVETKELAGEQDWFVSNPTQVNKWFQDRVETLNTEKAGKGTQLRQLVCLLKRFARSRRTWDLPNGMKLTMLVDECQPTYDAKLDKAFRNLLKKLKTRLLRTKIIRNRAHPDKPMITRTTYDRNVTDLFNETEKGLKELEILDFDTCTRKEARKAWDYIFKSDGFFKNWDDEHGDEEEKNAKHGIAGGTPRRAFNRHPDGGQYA